MGKIFTELFKKHGYGLVMSAIALDGYRRTVKNDNMSKKLETIRAEAAARTEAANIAERAEYYKNLAASQEKTKTCAVRGRHKEAADDYPSSVEAYTKSPSEYRKNEVDRAKQKLDKSYDEIKELTESSIYEYFNLLYNNYTEYLDSLTPDKIVCVFNIIIGSLTLSSFVSILSIMLSENVINKIKILERFPRILALLKIRNNIDKTQN